jgi:hypothetical protein
MKTLTKVFIKSGQQTLTKVFLNFSGKSFKNGGPAGVPKRVHFTSFCDFFTKLSKFFATFMKKFENF